MVMTAAKLKSLLRGLKDRVVGVFSKKIPLLYESWGEEHADKTYFVIRRGGNCGLFSYYLTAICGIKYALGRGWIPVVDLQTLPNIYLESDEVGKKNAWEYYFQQPCGVGLSDIKKAKNVIITKDFDWPEFPLPTMKFLTQPSSAMTSWRSLVADYVRLSPQASLAVEAAAQNLFPDGFSDMLGVFVRGTDYVKVMPCGHTVQPSAEVVISDCRQWLSQKNYRALFLVTEDLSVLRKFKLEFKQNVRYVSQNLLEYRSGYLGECSPRRIRPDELKQQGMDYLVNIFLLARCAGLIASRASGSMVERFITSGHADRKYYDLGVYGRFGNIVKEGES